MGPASRVLGGDQPPTPAPLHSRPPGAGGGSYEGQEHEVMETQAAKGGPRVPWERDELWAPFISTGCHGDEGGARRETGLSLSRTWPGTGIRAKDACGLGTRGQEPRPRPSSSDLGVQAPRPSSLRPGGPGPPAPPPSDPGVQAPSPSPLRPRGLDSPTPSLFTPKNPGSQSFLSQTPVTK